MSESSPVRALVLPGGGANGAYQVGAIGYLMGKRKFQYPILTGTSVGAINAVFLAMYALGDEVEASRELFDMWHRLKGNKSVYRDWPVLGKLSALWKPSVFDSAPVHQLVRDTLVLHRVVESGRQLAVGAVSLNTGKLVTWRENDPDLADGVLASAAFPGMFLPIRAVVGKYMHDLVDGGVREVSPLKAAIRMGATELHIVLPSPKDPSVVTRTEWTTLEVAQRSLQLMVDEIMDNDLKLCEARNHVEGYKKVKVVLIRPISDLGDSFDFGRKKNHRLIHRGFRDAELTFELG